MVTRGHTTAILSGCMLALRLTLFPVNRRLSQLSRQSQITAETSACCLFLIQLLLVSFDQIKPREPLVSEDVRPPPNYETCSSLLFFPHCTLFLR